MPAISFKGTTKLFRSSAGPAVNNVTLDVEEGELVVLLGPSGCGKTTLLRMVNRLIEPTSGEIFVEGREIHEIRKAELRRHIGYVIQQVGLFPHMTVGQNIAVVPRLLGWPRGRIHERTEELLDLVGLPADQYLKRYPRQLSGGQQQRVGIARAMAADPGLMLMDEPFGAIDAITRTDLQNELLKIQRKVAKTILFVTHDVEEGLRLGDRMAVMRLGEVVQYCTPLELLSAPADDFVRNLLGADDVFRQLSLVNISQVLEPLDGRLDHGKAVTVADDIDLRTALSALIGRGVSEATVIGRDGQAIGKVTLRRMLHEAAELDKGRL